MAEYKPSGKSMQERLNDRLKNSGDATADVVVKHGDGSRRTFHNLHIRGQGGGDRRVDLNGGVKGDRGNE